MGLKPTQIESVPPIREAWELHLTVTQDILFCSNLHSPPEPPLSHADGGLKPSPCRGPSYCPSLRPSALPSPTAPQKRLACLPHCALRPPPPDGSSPWLSACLTPHLLQLHLPAQTTLDHPPLNCCACLPSTLVLGLCTLPPRVCLPLRGPEFLPCMVQPQKPSLPVLGRMSGAASRTLRRSGDVGRLASQISEDCLGSNPMPLVKVGW